MSNLNEIEKYQFNEIIDIYALGDNEIFNNFNSEIELIFRHIFLINLFANRIEIKEKFTSQYFKVSFSCLLEAFILILENRNRASNLVLRSSIENFIKHIIFLGNEDVNDRNYNKNKTTLDRITEAIPSSYFSMEGKRINTYFENEYGRLSGLSHSITPLSIESIKLCISDLNRVCLQTVYSTLKEFQEITKNIFLFMIVASYENLKDWETEFLEEILRLAFGSRKTDTIIQSIKN